jgi:hypothetical protein
MVLLPRLCLISKRSLWGEVVRYRAHDDVPVDEVRLAGSRPCKHQRITELAESRGCVSALAVICLVWAD